MKHRQAIACTLLAVFSLLALSALPSFAQEKEEPKPVHAPDALPDVEPAMLTPEYWIALHRDVDTVVMTPSQIEAWNARVRAKHVELNDVFGKRNPLVSNYALKRQVGIFMNPILPLEQPATLSGDSLRTWIAANLEWVRSRDFYDGRNAIYNEKMIGELEASMNLAAIPRTITRRFGIIVERGDIRLFPTHIPGYTELRYEMDNFQNTSIYMSAPVAILHESRDGDYLYIESPVARGWISSKTVAVGDPKTIANLIRTDNMLMATANKVPVYGDHDCTVFRQYLYFSEYTPFVKKTSKAWVVRLPERKPDGSIGAVEGYLKLDADVHQGFMPYTKRNIITQAFKLLHQPYGWADQLKNRDCSGTMRVLYRCFGFTMGRWPNFQLLAPPDKHIHYIDPSLSEEDKIAEAAKLEPFTTIAGSGGHVVLWLGRAGNGKYYFLHQGGWGYDEDGQHFIVNRVALNEATHKWYNIRSAPVFSTIRD